METFYFFFAAFLIFAVLVRYLAKSSNKAHEIIDEWDRQAKAAKTIAELEDCKTNLIDWAKKGWMPRGESNRIRAILWYIKGKLEVLNENIRTN